jgi:thiamine biosynthesis lipoprotein
LRRVVKEWGTVISIEVCDATDERLVDACVEWFRRVDTLFSTWRDDSEIMQIGRGEVGIDDVDEDVRTVLAQSEQMRLESNGAFDISFATHPATPMREGFAPLDPSGIVKGWAIDRAAAMLHDAGASSFFINAGGDVVVRGRPNDGSNTWRVGIQHPWERDRVAAVVAVSDAAVATSGIAERGDHVIDPRTGIPASALVSVTVVGPEAWVADAYATAACVMGPVAGMEWLSTRLGYEAMGITVDQEVVTTTGFDRLRVS